MTGLTKKFIGFAFLGGTYQSIKKTLKSDSILGSSFYSGLAGLLATGAYRLLDADGIRDRLEGLLDNEDPEVAKQATERLNRLLLGLNLRDKQTRRDYSQIESYKEQLKKERGYRA